MGRLCRLWVIAFPTAFGCSGGGGPAPGPAVTTCTENGSADGGTGNGILYDDLCALECLGAIRCLEGQTPSGCACVPDPSDTEETNRVGCAELMGAGGEERTPEDDFCAPTGSEGATDLGCFMPGMLRMQGPSRMVSLFGVVDVFGNGGDADEILVEIYLEGEDGALGASVGMATASIGSPCAETEAEYDNDMEIGTRNLGFYRVDDVPTETALIIKTSGNPSFWRDLYTYNIVIDNESIDESALDPGACPETPDGPRYRYEGKILSRSDYTSIPLTAGHPSGIARGHGALAGEVHDCGDVRLEFAQVATNPPPVAFTFFNDNPENPLPDRARTHGTSLLGLYASIDIRSGPVDVAAVGRVGASFVSLGWYRAQVFEDSVTVVTLRGLRAHQITPASQ